MNQTKKRTFEEVMHDAQQGVNNTTFENFKFNIISSLILTGSIFTLSLIVVATSANSSILILIMALLSLLMAIILWGLHKKINQAETSSIQHIQQEAKNFYPELHNYNK